MIRVLVVDDHPEVRRGIKQILSDDPEMVVGGEAASAAGALELARKDGWAIVLLDVSLPDRSGLAALADLKREHPQLPVLILSMHPEDQFAGPALRAGAAGYLTKERAPEELASTIRRILDGGADGRRD